MDHKARCQQALDLVTRYGHSSAASAATGIPARTLRERVQKAKEYYSLTPGTKPVDSNLVRAHG